MTPRGAFIVFEGLDRCGKTTQVEALADALRREGRQVRCAKFPGELQSQDAFQSLRLEDFVKSHSCDRHAVISARCLPPSTAWQC
jgi:thymidylate kinase